MGDQLEIWATWGTRYREMAKESGKTPEAVGAAMQPPRAESTIRSWTNGTRQINLTEFFELCRAAELDPAMVLFGGPVMTEELRKSLSETVQKALDADPAANPSYGKLGNKLRKGVGARRAAHAAAVSRLKT